MEDYRDKVVVILAGYEDEMSTFLDANPGFKSRIPFNFYFQDYTCSELETIAGMQYQKQSLSLAPNAGGTLQAVLRFTTGCCEELRDPPPQPRAWQRKGTGSLFTITRLGIKRR